MRDDLSKHGGALVFSLALLVCTFVVPAPHAVADSYKTERIIKKHIKAVGGKAMKQDRARQAFGRAELLGFELPFVLWMQRPNLSRLDMTIREQSIIQACDGRVAWWVNPFLGVSTPEEMPEEIARHVILWSDFDGPLIGHREAGTRVDYMGRVKLDTGAAHRLKLTFVGGDIWNVFLDAETYLEVKRSYAQTFGGVTTEATAYFSNFVEVGGVTLPGEIRGIAIDGTPYLMIFESFETNVDPDESRFALPRDDG